MSSNEGPERTIFAVTIGVLALQGAFHEHQSILESIRLPDGWSVSTRQIRTPRQLLLEDNENDGGSPTHIHGIILPGGESTAMGLIGTSNGMWDALRWYVRSGRPVWGTCAGMILLAERCVGTSAVIEHGQALIGGMDVLVCRNYFGSQISSFEMDTPPPPLGHEWGRGTDTSSSFPGVFIRAPAILSVGDDDDVQVLGKVVAAPCKQAAAVLRELEKKIEAGEDVVTMGVVDALARREEASNISSEIKCLDGIVVSASGAGVAHAAPAAEAAACVAISIEGGEEEKKEVIDVEVTEEEETKLKQKGCESAAAATRRNIKLPDKVAGTDAREVICAVRKGNILCTAFHPELTGDDRWHAYFADMVFAHANRDGGSGGSASL